MAAEYHAVAAGFLAAMISSERASHRPQACPSRRRSLAGLFLAAILGLFPPSLHAQGTDYRIGPQDLVAIKVYEAPEFNVEVRVAADGRVSLPNAGGITVGGLSEAGAAKEVERVLEQCCINRATVTVQVKEFRFKPIRVIGAVGRPGPLESSGRLTLLDVLTAAGGLGPQHGDVVYVLRHADNGLSDQLSVRLDDLLLKGDARVNIPIFPDDLVNVPATVEVTVFVLGEVQHPGAVTFKSTDRLSLLTTIARAGGLTDRASHRIEIKREGGGGIVEAIEVDYKGVLAGKVPDPTLKEGDVVYVKESFF
jgi:polysaccharide export outer membrane protein